VTTYTLLFLDADEHIGKSRQIECPSDEQVVDMAAHETGDYRAIQVWSGDRPVALIGNPRNLQKGAVAVFRFAVVSVRRWSDGAKKIGMNE